MMSVGIGATPGVEIENADDKFWAAVERAEQQFNGNPDRQAWIDAVMRAGATKDDATQMFDEAHEDHHQADQ